MKETGPSRCNPVGYWKNEDRNVCLTYDDAFKVGLGPTKLLTSRRCKSGIRQKWAMYRSHICHPVEDKCFTIFRDANKNRDLVGLLPFHENADQKWKWNSNYPTNLVS